MPKNERARWLPDAVAAGDESSGTSKPPAPLWGLCTAGDRAEGGNARPHDPGGSRALGCSDPCAAADADAPAPVPALTPRSSSSVTTRPGCAGDKGTPVRGRARASPRPPSGRPRAYHPLAAAVERVSLPEAPAVPADEAHLARRELEARPPHQRAVPEDPHGLRQLRAARLPRDRGGEERGGRLRRFLQGQRVSLHGALGAGPGDGGSL